MLSHFLRAAVSSSTSGIVLVNTTSYFTSTATASLTMNVPSGTVEGDLMVAWLTKSGGSDTYTQPSGWTELVDVGGTNESFMVAIRVATAGEPANYTWTTPNTGNNKSGNIITFRYASYDTAAGISVVTNSPAASRTASFNNSWLLLIGRDTQNGNTINFSGATTIARYTANNPSSVVQYRQVNAGATGTTSVSSGDLNDPLFASFVIYNS